MNQEKIGQAINFHEEHEEIEYSRSDILLEKMTNWVFYMFLITGIPLIINMLFQL